jgi:hypothetical protein
MSEKIMQTLIFSIPEAIIILNLASSLSGKKITWIRLIFMGIILGTVAYILRETTGSYILNIFFSSLLAILLLKLFGSCQIFEAATSGLTAISLYLAVEFLNVKSLQILTGIDPIRLGEDFNLRVLWFLPQIIAATGLSFIIRYFVSRQSKRELNVNKEI